VIDMGVRHILVVISDVAGLAIM